MSKFRSLLSRLSGFRRRKGGDTDQQEKQGKEKEKGQEQGQGQQNFQINSSKEQNFDDIIIGGSPRVSSISDQQQSSASTSITTTPTLSEKQFKKRFFSLNLNTASSSPSSSSENDGKKTKTPTPSKFSFSSHLIGTKSNLKTQQQQQQVSEKTIKFNDQFEFDLKLLQLSLIDLQKMKNKLYSIEALINQANYDNANDPNQNNKSIKKMILEGKKSIEFDQSKLSSVQQKQDNFSGSLKKTMIPETLEQEQQQLNLVSTSPGTSTFSIHTKPLLIPLPPSTLLLSSSTTSFLMNNFPKLSILNMSPTNYHLIYIIQQDLIISLIQFDSLEQAKIVSKRNENLYHVLNKFHDYFKACNRNSILWKISELIKCYSDNPRWTVAHYAAYFDYSDYFLFPEKFGLTMKELQDQNNPDGWAPLHIAVSMSNLFIVGLMLKKGIDVFVVDGHGWTPTHFAMITSPRVIATLIEMPSFYQQLRHVDRKGMTPIHVACMANYGHHLQRIMLQGVTAQQLTLSKPKPPPIDGPAWNDLYNDQTPYLKFTAKELDQDFDWTMIQYCGTPLHWCKNFPMLQRLLESKYFSVNFRNLLGDTPLITYVNISRTTSTKNSLFRQPTKMDLNSLLGQSLSITYRTQWLLALITSGAYLNATNETGNTALHYAVLNGLIVPIQVLIIFGARINVKNRNGHSPLHLASVKLDQLKKSKRFNTLRRLIGGKRNLLLKTTSTTTTAIRQPEPSNPQQQQEYLLANIKFNESKSKSKSNEDISNDSNSASSDNSKNQTSTIKNLATNRHIQRSIKVYEKVIELLQIFNPKKCPEFLKNECTITCRSNKIDGKSPDNHINIANNKIPHIITENDNCENLFYFDLFKSSSPSSNINNNNNNNKEEKFIKKKFPCILSLDGSLNDSFINPLIEALILNELQRFLKYPILNYFQIISGTSFGFTIASLLATGKKPIEICYFFLMLHGIYKKPSINFQDKNTEELERELKKIFSNKTLFDIFNNKNDNNNNGGQNVQKNTQEKQHEERKSSNIHLILTSSMVNHKPSKLITLDYLNEPELLVWKACRIAGSGAGLYKYFEYKSIPYYDGSLVSPNPTIDTLTRYYSIQYDKWISKQQQPNPKDDKVIDNENINENDNNGDDELLESTKKLPIHFVLSIGCGKIFYRHNLNPIDLNQLTPPMTNLKEYFSYFQQLRDWFANVTMETDQWIIDRTRFFLLTQKINFARINVFYDKDDAKKFLTELNKLSGLTLYDRTTKSLPLWENQLKSYVLLIQILFNVKKQLFENRKNLKELAKFLSYYHKKINNLENVGKEKIDETSTPTTTTITKQLEVPESKQQQQPDPKLLEEEQKYPKEISSQLQVIDSGYFDQKSLTKSSNMLFSYENDSSSYKIPLKFDVENSIILNRKNLSKTQRLTTIASTVDIDDTVEFSKKLTKISAEKLSEFNRQLQKLFKSPSKVAVSPKTIKIIRLSSAPKSMVSKSSMSLPAEKQIRLPSELKRKTTPKATKSSSLSLKKPKSISLSNKNKSKSKSKLNLAKSKEKITLKVKSSNKLKEKSKSQSKNLNKLPMTMKSKSKSDLKFLKKSKSRITKIQMERFNSKSELIKTEKSQATKSKSKLKFSKSKSSTKSKTKTKTKTKGNMKLMEKTLKKMEKDGSTIKISESNKKIKMEIDGKEEMKKEN